MAEPIDIVDRMLRAMNAHDLDGFVDCFRTDYKSEQPAHPERGFGGSDQVRANWTIMFDAFPDFRADVLRKAADGDTVWSEWRWGGTHKDGSPMEMRGIIVMGVMGDKIAWARLFIEQVEQAGADIDVTMRQIAAREES